MFLKLNMFSTCVKSTLLILSIATVTLSYSLTVQAKDEVTNVAWQQALPTIKTKANKGDTESQARLGSMYLEGIGVEKDTDKALYWLEKSSKNNPKAQWLLAEIYLDDKYGINKNFEKGFFWTQKAAENGAYASMNELTHMYRHGIGTDINYEKTFFWQKQLVKSTLNQVFGMRDEELTLAAMYYCGMGTPKSIEKEQALKTKATGDSISNTSISYIYGGICYEVGEYSLALPFIKAGAQSGVDESQLLLGEMYHFGIGDVEQNIDQAIFWYTKAADQGNNGARLNLAMLYTDGMGMKKDYQQALILYLQAIAAGYPLAMNNMGDLYENGYGVPQDFSKAKEYYLKAIENNVIFGYHSMGSLYKRGHGVEKNLDKAKQWYQQACDKGLQQGCDSVLEVEEMQATGSF